MTPTEAQSSSMGKVIELERYRETSGRSLPSGQPVQVDGTLAHAQPSPGETARALSELYPGSSSNSLLEIALKHIEDGFHICERVLDMLLEDETFHADLEAMRLGPIFVELFCCREIGEGFANTADSLINALRSCKANSLTREQILVIRDTLEALYQSPALTFDASLLLVEKLNNVDLDTEPELNAIAELDAASDP